MTTTAFSLSTRAIAAAALALAIAFPASAATTVFARTYRGSFNDNFSTSSSTEINGATFALADRATDGGFAQAAAHSTAGALAGMSQVIISTGPGGLSGSMEARSSASSAESIAIGDLYCVGLDCVSASALGIARLEYTFTIRASAGTSAFATSAENFAANGALTDVTFNWSFAGASASGHRRVESGGSVTGDIASRTVTVSVAPKSEQILSLAFSTYSQAGTILFPGASRMATANASSIADFQHTLQWEGIQGVRAFAADGSEIALADGGRFTLLGESGFDFWNAAPGFATGGVPEPSAWALLIVGFGAVGARLRSRRRRPALVYI